MHQIEKFRASCDLSLFALCYSFTAAAAGTLGSLPSKINPGTFQLGTRGISGARNRNDLAVTVRID